MADERKVTVIRVAEAVAWVQIADGEPGLNLPTAHGGFSFEHDANERVLSVDYSRIPNQRPREVPAGTAKDAPRIKVAPAAMRVLFVSEPMTPEEAADGEEEIAIDVERVEAAKKIVLPGQ